MCTPISMPNEAEAKRFMMQRTYTRAFDARGGRSDLELGIEPNDPLFLSTFATDIGLDPNQGLPEDERTAVDLR